MHDTLKQIFADIFRVDINIINDNFGPKTAPTWDSMNHLKLITALEDNFSVRFSMAEIREMSDFAKVVTILSKKQP